MTKRQSETSFGHSLVIRHSSFSAELFQSAFIKFDQIEIRSNVVATFASRFLEKMDKARLFCSSIRMSGNHRRIPLFNCFERMSRRVFLHQFENCSYVLHVFV